MGRKPLAHLDNQPPACTVNRYRALLPEQGCSQREGGESRETVQPMSGGRSSAGALLDKAMHAPSSCLNNAPTLSLQDID